MKKVVLILIILALTSITTLALLSSDPKNSESYSYDHSWTKAICDENNYCQDYIVFCKGKEIVSISPITGAVIQFSEDWTDPRDEELKNRFC